MRQRSPNMYFYCLLSRLALRIDLTPSVLFASKDSPLDRSIQ